LLFILEKKVFLAKEYLLHLINKCSSSSTASQLHLISAHKPEIERGRYTIPKTAVENRICKQCNCEAVEDEEHLLITYSKAYI
jgi:hypothetical protein